MYKTIIVCSDEDIKRLTRLMNQRDYPVSNMIDFASFISGQSRIAIIDVVDAEHIDYIFRYCPHVLSEISAVLCVGEMELKGILRKYPVFFI